MGRQDVASERRRQVIDATIRSMAVNGFRGTTLERIAELAGMARGHVRHFAGNRDELLIDAAAVFFFGPAAAAEPDIDVLARSFPLVRPDQTIEEGLDYLFGEFALPGRENASAFAFRDAGRTIPRIHSIVMRAYESIEESLNVILRRGFASADPEHSSQVARSIVTMALGNAVLNDLQSSTADNGAARDQALALIQQLSKDNGDVLQEGWRSSGRR